MTRPLHLESIEARVARQRALLRKAGAPEVTAAHVSAHLEAALAQCDKLIAALGKDVTNE